MKVQVFHVLKELHVSIERDREKLNVFTLNMVENSIDPSMHIVESTISIIKMHPLKKCLGGKDE